MTPDTDNTLTPFVVDTPPFIHRGYTVHGMMRDTLIALAPAAILAVLQYGLPAFRVMALAAGSAALVEAVWQRLLGREICIYDLTALITGLTFAFLLPAGAPWWLVITGAALTIILGRQVFGGVGCNPLCPPLVGWALMVVAWPTYMDPSAVLLNTDLVDPLIKIKFFGWQSLPAGSEISLLLGRQLGALGATQIAAVLAGGLFLVARKTVRWEIPLAFIVAVMGAGELFWHFGELMGVNAANLCPPHLYLLTGSTLFVAFFLATDYSSSPVGLTGMILYGLLCGTMVVLIRIFGIYPDGAPFAVLVASLCTPLFDLIRAAPYGKRG